MALHQINALPGIVRRWIEQLGLLPDDFLAVYNEYATKYEVPPEFGTAIKAWIDANVATGVDAIVVTLLSAWAEWNSANPGWNADHAGTV